MVFEIYQSAGRDLERSLDRRAVCGDISVSGGLHGGRGSGYPESDRCGDRAAHDAFLSLRMQYVHLYVYGGLLRGGYFPGLHGGMADSEISFRLCTGNCASGPQSGAVSGLAVLGAGRSGLRPVSGSAAGGGRAAPDRQRDPCGKGQKRILAWCENFCGASCICSPVQLYCETDLSGTGFL